MAYYGNILIVYNATASQLHDVEQVLTNNNTDCERVESSFFIETSSMDNTGKVVKDLHDLGIEFLFFHNHIADGSLVDADGLSVDTVQRINEILFK